MGCDGVAASVGGFLRAGLGLGQLSAPLRPCCDPNVCGALAGKPFAHFDASRVVYSPGAILGRGFGLAVIHGETFHRWNRIHVGCSFSARRALPLQTAFAVVVLGLSRCLPLEANLNFAWRDPFLHRSLGPAWLHLAVTASVLVICIYWPTHWILDRLFPAANVATGKRQ